MQLSNYLFFTVTCRTGACLLQRVRAGTRRAVARRRRRACGGSENHRARDGGDIEGGQRAVSPVRFRSGAWRRRRRVRDAVGAVRRRVPTRPRGVRAS